jgi:DNA replication protein DnaC
MSPVPGARVAAEPAVQALLEAHLKALRLPTFVHHHRKVAEEAAQANLNYEQYLLILSETEVAQRERNQQTRCIRAARFPVFKELSDFDFSALPLLNKARVLDLARGDYIAKAENLILLGAPGLGKTHAATGLALAACRQKHRVRFYNAANLVNELIDAHTKLQMTRFIQTALRQQLIVIDELGFIPFTDQGAQLMFQMCSALHERVAVIVTTNLPFTKWTQLFLDETLTAALLDRLTHRAHILEFSGTESFRLKQRLKKQEVKPGD